MAKFSCFSVMVGRKKKYREEEESPDLVKVVRDKRPVGSEAAEVAYEGEDEHEKNFQAYVADRREEVDQSMNKNMCSFTSIDNEMEYQLENKSERDTEVGVELIQGEHASYPGIRKAEFWALSGLKRSCSNLETRDMLKKIADQLPLLKSSSFKSLKSFMDRKREKVTPGIQGSPVSVMNPRSADRVMLKRHSSSQILPPSSRRLWWKLFLWSHWNLQKPWSGKPKPLSIKHFLNQRGGYSSDPLEPNRGTELGKLESPESFTSKSRNNGSINNNLNWNKFHGEVSAIWAQNQWVAFPTESSSMRRVDEWVNSLEIQPPLPINDEDNGDKGLLLASSPETSESPARSTSHMTQHPNLNISEEILHANSAIQSLNSSSTVAHMTGMGLKVIPIISRFSSLRSVNLSDNLIVHITPGLLPKVLHTLNLSRNKIIAIEGLRELTRLRVLDLSNNRIIRISHGLSNCTLIKELYLAGNKISDVEGLHRLLKLTVLDLSFNKISTAKALGQLVANYNSLMALNLLGNPIQRNIGEDQLPKAVSGLLPQLAYLNKLPIKPQNAREVAKNSFTKAALGDNGWTSHRKAVTRVGHGGSSSSNRHRNSIGGSRQKSSQRSKRSRHHSPMKWRSSSFASVR